MDKITKVKAKKEFSELPDSVVDRALENVGGEVKDARALLRKYFGVFLTHKVLRAEDESVLKSHISSHRRDYELLYGEILSDKKNFKTVIDLGCGVNGFSYEFLRRILGDVRYIGVEAVGQVVENTNQFFEKNNFNGKVIHGDLFDINFIKKILEKQEKPGIVFMFQVVSALEYFEKDFSKKLLSEVIDNCERVVLSWPLNSLSGKKSFVSNRKWLTDFIEENFKIYDDFRMRGERFLIIGK